jgi:hypothetical protein
MWRRIVLAECANVKIGRGAFRSTPVPAARRRPTVTNARADRTLIRPAPLWMVRVVVMAYRVVPGFAPAGALAGKRGFATRNRVTLINWPPGIGSVPKKTNRGSRHKVSSLAWPPEAGRQSAFPEQTDTLVGSLQADAIRACLVTCESRTFLIRSRPNQGTQALAESSRKVCLQRHRIW